jgi:transposase
LHRLRGRISFSSRPGSRLHLGTRRHTRLARKHFTAFIGTHQLVWCLCQGQAFIWHEGKCNGEHTVQFLQRLTAWPHLANRQLVIIWDGAPWHRSQTVRTQAQQLGIELIQLPAYSPDLNPIEGLWKWMREEVTQHFCHDSLQDLFRDCSAFIERINLDPDAMISRLWPRFALDPDYEKLLLP